MVRVTCSAPDPASIVLHDLTLLPATDGDGSELLATPTGAETTVTCGETPGAGCVMADGAEYTALFLFTPTRDVESTSVGAVSAKWARADAHHQALANLPTADAESAALTKAQTFEATAQLVSALPAVTVRGAAFGLEWELPTEGRLGQLLTMRLKVVNHTNELRALRLTFSENAAFLFCGLKLFHFRLPPAFSQSLSFNLVPIKTGEVHLPSPKLLCVTTGAEVIDPAAKHRVFVRPSELVANWANVPTHPNTVGARQVA